MKKRILSLLLAVTVPLGAVTALAANEEIRSPGISLTREDDLSYTVQPDGIDGPCTVVLTTYDDERLVEVLIKACDGETVGFAPSKPHDLCKAMAVDGNFRPLCPESVRRVRGSEIELEDDPVSDT